MSRVNIDSALKSRSFFQRHFRRNDIALGVAGAGQQYFFAAGNVALYFPVDANDFSGYVGVYAPCSSNDEFVGVQRHRAIDLTFNHEAFIAGDIALDFDSGPQSGRFPAGCRWSGTRWRITLGARGWSRCRSGSRCIGTFRLFVSIPVKHNAHR